jgi:Dolichyl-phosphate-mannose-protein mannosyltransferase
MSKLAEYPAKDVFSRSAHSVANHQRLLLVTIAVLAAMLDLSLATRSGLWADELFSLAIATGHSLEHPVAVADPSRGDFVEPNGAVAAQQLRRYLEHEHPPATPGRIVRAVLLSDTSPPLYYLLLYLWTIVVGTSDLSLRLFSVVCSLVCLPLLAAIARRVTGKGAVLPACALFAISPLAAYYSSEGRMYSLLWLCVLTTLWATLRLHRGEHSLFMWALWVFASIAGFLTHYFFVFPWGAIAILLISAPGAISRKRLVLSILVVAAMLLPWYIHVPRSIGSWRVTGGWLDWRPSGFSRLRSAVNLVVQFFSGGAEDLWSANRLERIAPLLLFCGVAIVTLWRLRARVLSWPFVLLVASLVAACAGPLLFDLVRHTYTSAVPRYAISALPQACLLAGIGLSCLSPRARTLILLLIVLAWSPGLLVILRSRARNQSPIREIAQAASANRRASDLILVHSIPSGVAGIARYANGPARLAAWVGQLKTRRVPDSIQWLAAGHAHIVLVKVHEVGEPAPEEDWLRSHASTIKEARIGTGTIVEFQPRNSPRF